VARGGASDTLTFEIEGERQFKLSLGRMGKALGDMRPYWDKALKPTFYKVEAEQFASQGGAGRSGAWAGLSKPYAAWKAKRYPGKGILERTGALKASLLGGAGQVYESHPTWMAIGSGIEYGTYHQRGGGNLPKRPPISVSASQEKALFGPAFALIARELGQMWQGGKATGRTF